MRREAGHPRSILWPKARPIGASAASWRDRLARAVQQVGARIIFRPYPLAQVHATVLGLERLPQPALYNRNMLEFRGELRAMRLPELFGFILQSGHLPFDAQFGGFEDCDYPFRSRGARPFDRSFSIQGRTAVIIGWPVRAARDRRSSAPDWPLILDELRRSAQRFGVLHRWHPEPSDVDNDLYLRLGLLDGELARFATRAGRAGDAVGTQRLLAFDTTGRTVRSRRGGLSGR